MKTKNLIVLSVIVFVGMFMAFPVLGDNSNEAERKASMESIVNAYIAACEAKSALLDSRSETLRKAAMLACLKAVFCKNSKEELIGELLSNGIEPKPYKVHHFLNARFMDVVGARELDM